MHSACLQNVCEVPQPGDERRISPDTLEMTHTINEDRDTEMPGQDNTPLQRPLPGDEAPWPTLERLRELATKNMPNAITFIPHRVRNRFARICSSKLNEVASLMRKGDDTQEREMLILLVWAIPALTLSADEAGTERHTEHHSRAAGLNQRLAAAERDEWNGKMERASQKQQEEEKICNLNSTQLEDKAEQSAKQTMDA